MPSLSEIAAEHQRRRNVVADRAVSQSLRLWRDMNPMSLDAGWDEVVPELVGVVSKAQVTAARQATPYVNAVGGSQAAATLVPAAFAGATREGREVGPEMFAAVTTTKRLIGAGAGFPAAFRAGAAFLSVVVATMVADAGRSADSTIAVSRGFAYSVRVIQPGACSRCAILAGVKGYKANFERHPRCRCTSMPLRDTDTPDGFFRSTDEYFESLPKAEQDRVFTKAGAEAIRAGADPMKVVNARRGANGISFNSRGTGRAAPGRLQPVTVGTRPDGTPIQVYATTEGTTRRGVYGRRTDKVRLMPETIMQTATSPEHARELLAKYGYIN